MSTFLYYLLLDKMEWRKIISYYAYKLKHYYRVCEQVCQRVFVHECGRECHTEHTKLLLLTEKKTENYI